MKYSFLYICISIANVYIFTSSAYRVQKHHDKLLRKRREAEAEAEAEADPGNPSGPDDLACVAETESNNNGTARIQLCNVKNYFYLGHIRLGFPPQTLWMEFDTGSATTWVMTSLCKSPSCKSAQRFDPRESITFVPIRETFNFTYGAGDSVSGIHAKDFMCIGQLCLANQSIGAAVQVNQQNMIADGLIGLAYPSLSILGSPLIANLKPKLLEPLFAVWLQRNAFKVSNGGEITFGYTNPDRYTGEFTYIPVTNESYWTIKMDSVVQTLPTGNSEIVACARGCKAIVDTATSFILGANNETAKMLENWDRMGLIQKDRWGDYYADCNQLTKLPKLAFVFNNQRFEIKPEDYTFAENPKFPCKRQVAIEGDIPDLDFWVLGGSFLGPYYTVFDFGQKRVGIATAKVVNRSE